MSRTLRAFATTAALGLSLVVVPAATATAAQGPARIKGTKAVVLRGDSTLTRGPSRPHAVTSEVPVSGPARSTWHLTFPAQDDSNTPCEVAPGGATAAFQAAVNTLAAVVASTKTINVALCFAALGPGVLGYAGPSNFYPLTVAQGGDGSTYYPSALADAISGTDVGGAGASDISADFSSTESGIYYGTDGNPGGGEVDFVSIVMHELTHGLGFTGTADYDPLTGKGYFYSPPAVFDNLTANGAGTSLRNIYSNGSTGLGTALTNDAVFWNGANAKAANGGAQPKLYAPGATHHLPADSCSGGGTCDTDFSPGSSIAHLDEDTYAYGSGDELMTPYLSNGEVTHTPGRITVGMLRDMGWDAELGKPGAPTSVFGEPSDSSVDLFWTAPSANGSPITGYAVDVYESGPTFVKQVVSAGAGTSVSIPGLDNAKTYTFKVSATNGFGTGTASASSAAVQPAPDVTAPTVTITSPHAQGYGPAAGYYLFSATDPGHSHPTFTYECTVDSNLPVACSNGGLLYSTPLANGSQHVFSVVATDAAGNPSAPATASWTVDGQLPTLTTPVLATYSLASRLGFNATGTDSGSGLKNYDFRYRQASYSNQLSGFISPASWLANSAGAVSLPAAQGFTYCFSARSRDRAGNVSAWSADRCVGTALDDRGLAASTGWTRGTGSAHFRATFTSTTRTGVTLTRTGVSARRLALIATTCKGCGTVGVYWRGKLVKNINLNATATHYRQVIPAITFAGISSGTVTITSLTAGRFYVDGLLMTKA